MRARMFAVISAVYQPRANAVVILCSHNTGSMSLLMVTREPAPSASMKYSVRPRK